MKTLIQSLFLAAVTSASALAQSAGQINYEAMVKLDPSQIRIVINGQAVSPGDPNFPADIPDSRSFELKLQFAGNYGKEINEGANMMVRRFVGGPGGPEGGPALGGPGQAVNISRPFDEQTYLDLSGRNLISVLSIKEGETTKSYRSEKPIAAASNWQYSDQTKKIAGYVCRKATATLKNETVTLWVTTDLPFTYSPVRELMPDKGVVLALESPRQAFRATKVDTKATVNEKDLKPSADAQVVSAEQLQDLRQKAQADFRARLMNEMERN